MQNRLNKLKLRIKSWLNNSDNKIFLAIEFHEDFLYNFPLEHPKVMTTIKVYSQGEQPVLVIYKVNNSFKEETIS